MIDFSALGKIKSGWSTFTYNHPKVKEFIGNVSSKNFTEGQEIAIAVRYPDGTEYKTGIRLKSSDLDFVESLQKITKNMG